MNKENNLNDRNKNVTKTTLSGIPTSNNISSSIEYEDSKRALYFRKKRATGFCFYPNQRKYSWNISK